MITFTIANGKSKTSSGADIKYGKPIHRAHYFRFISMNEIKIYMPRSVHNWCIYTRLCDRLSKFGLPIDWLRSHYPIRSWVLYCSTCEGYVKAYSFVNLYKTSVIWLTLLEFSTLNISCINKLVLQPVFTAGVKQSIDSYHLTS